MSAFLVGDGTIDRAVAAIVEMRDAATPEERDWVMGGLPFAPDASPDEIGAALLRLNMESLHQRYDEPITDVS